MVIGCWFVLKLTAKSFSLLIECPEFYLQSFGNKNVTSF